MTTLKFFFGPITMSIWNFFFLLLFCLYFGPPKLVKILVHPWVCVCVFVPITWYIQFLILILFNLNFLMIPWEKKKKNNVLPLYVFIDNSCTFYKFWFLLPLFYFIFFIFVFSTIEVSSHRNVWKIIIIILRIDRKKNLNVHYLTNWIGVLLTYLFI